MENLKNVCQKLLSMCHQRWMTVRRLKGQNKPLSSNYSRCKVYQEKEDSTKEAFLMAMITYSNSNKQPCKGTCILNLLTKLLVLLQQFKNARLKLLHRMLNSCNSNRSLAIKGESVMTTSRK